MSHIILLQDSYFDGDNVLQNLYQTQFLFCQTARTMMYGLNLMVLEIKIEESCKCASMEFGEQSVVPVVF